VRDTVSSGAGAASGAGGAGGAGATGANTTKVCGGAAAGAKQSEVGDVEKSCSSSAVWCACGPAANDAGVVCREWTLGSTRERGTDGTEE